jgi:2-polyprenyl-3-methyl-5-hydroxy-6-metoxy-1,4-benzoquinol methylase
MFQPKHDSSSNYLQDLSKDTALHKIELAVAPGSTILDIGCCSGKLDFNLKAKGCKILGVEVDPEAAEKARLNCENVINADIEQIQTLPYPAGFFDAIILADILEHLKRPDLVIRKLKLYLKKEGLFFVSAPNFARLEIRLKLLSGRFEYTECGTLDKTHLRFFTQKTLKRLLEEEGLKVKRVEYTGLASQYGILRLFPNLFSFQFVVTASC